jgi:tripartite-type tricarboxylate transporter receptor subunit TctC
MTETHHPWRRGLIAIGIGLWLAGSANAQSAGADYPTRPITIVVPFTAGGGSDNVARLVATRITERTGKTIIIDNRGGAGTNIGNELAARATADGYTYLLGQFTLSVNPSLYDNLRYKVERDFVPVVHIADSPTVLAVGANSSIVDVKSLLSLAQTKPGKLNYGSGGSGTPPHLSGELYQKLTGTRMAHIPYKGSGPAITDLIAGQLDLMIDSSGAVLPQIKGGRLKALAIAGPKRLAELPDVPTFAEAGVSGMEVPAWYGFLAPTGTPAHAVQWLNAQVNEVLRDPAMVAKLHQIGAVPVGGTAAEFSAVMQVQAAKWSTIIKDSNIKLE